MTPAFEDKLVRVGGSGWLILSVMSLLNKLMKPLPMRTKLIPGSMSYEAKKTQMVVFVLSTHDE